MRAILPAKKMKGMLQKKIIKKRMRSSIDAIPSSPLMFWKIDA